MVLATAAAAAAAATVTHASCGVYCSGSVTKFCPTYNSWLAPSAFVLSTTPATI